jgi:nucleoside-diphosphate-sugar epimerase
MTAGTVLVTGAGGFIGRALAKRLSEQGAGRLLLCDRALPDPPPGAEAVQGDLSRPEVLEQLLPARPDVVFHLASVPSALSEAEPATSRAVNLDASLNLLERLAAEDRPVRMVYASTIAVLGSRFEGPVDDTLLPRPTLTYGTHKLMVETQLADWTRRGRLMGIALRLPGIVARPPSAAGFGSAFWSDVFHAVRGGQDYQCPAGPDAVGWLMSLGRCVDDLIHAAGLPEDQMQGAVTLPALNIRLGDLVEAIARKTGGPADAVRYAPDPMIMRNFGSYPELLTPAADARGLKHDGDVESLVANALADLEA